jgi:hypothetical protein
MARILCKKLFLHVGPALAQKAQLEDWSATSSSKLGCGTTSLGNNFPVCILAVQQLPGSNFTQDDIPGNCKMQLQFLRSSRVATCVCCNFIQLQL